MPDLRQLPSLLRLLDDETPLVRDTVLRELRAYGPSLEEALLRQGVSPRPEQWQLLRPLLEPHRGVWLRDHWNRWSDSPEDHVRLERALSLLAGYQDGPSMLGRTGALLDELAHQFANFAPHASARALAEFLFREGRIEGATREYYAPSSSNLAAVIVSGRGIPIALCSIFLLVGVRVGLEVAGCNFPRHFLALAREGEDTLVVDCYGQGRILEPSEIERLAPGAKLTLRDVVALRADAAMMVSRVLRNLVYAYRTAGEESSAVLMEELLRTEGEKKGR